MNDLQRMAAGHGLNLVLAILLGAVIGLAITCTLLMTGALQ